MAWDRHRYVRKYTGTARFYASKDGHKTDSRRSSGDLREVEAVPDSSVIHNPECDQLAAGKIVLHLSAEEIAVMIQLLEYAECEIHRIFKRLRPEDMDMKEIYYYYRYHGRFLRKKLRELRGY